MLLDHTLFKKTLLSFCALSLSACASSLLPNATQQVSAPLSSGAETNLTSSAGSGFGQGFGSGVAYVDTGRAYGDAYGMGAGHLDMLSPPQPTSAPTSAPMMAPEERLALPAEPSSPAPALMAPQSGSHHQGAMQSPQAAGLLTAGAWNDLSNWPFWLNLIQNGAGAQMPEIWGLNTQQRIPVQIHTASGLAAADIPVKLLNAQGQTVFEARTNLQGQAELFANFLTLSQQTQSTADWQIQVQDAQQRLTQEVRLPADPRQPLTFTLNEDPKPTDMADLMLMIDTTGSMSDELEYLKRELENVVNRIHAQSRQFVNLRLSANFYRDIGDEYVVRSFPFTDDLNQVKSQLAAQRADGGGDYPEAVDRALENAVTEHAWRAQARARLMFLVLDAPPHQSSENLQRLRSSLLKAAAAGIRIIPVASSGIDKETEFLLRMMAISTGGRYLFLTGDSGIGSGHIAPTIGAHQVEKLNDLMVRVASEYIHGNL